MSDGQDSKERGGSDVGAAVVVASAREFGATSAVGDEGRGSEARAAPSTLTGREALGGLSAQRAPRGEPDVLEGLDLHFEFALPLHFDALDGPIAPAPPAVDSAPEPRPSNASPPSGVSPRDATGDGPSIEWVMEEIPSPRAFAEGIMADRVAVVPPMPEVVGRAQEGPSPRVSDPAPEDAGERRVERGAPAAVPSEAARPMVVRLRPSEERRALRDKTSDPLPKAPSSDERPSAPGSSRSSRPSAPHLEAAREGVAPRRRSVPSIAIPPPTPSGGVARMPSPGTPTPSTGISRARIMALASGNMLPPSAPPTPAAGVHRPSVPIGSAPVQRPSPLATPAVVAERRSRPVITPEQRRADRVDRARACIAAGQFSEALDLIELIRAGGDDEIAEQLSGECALVQRIADEGEPDPVLELGGMRAVLMVRADPASIRGMALDHRAGFLLSMIDGVLSVEDLCDMGHMPTGQTLSLLVELKRRGLIG
jgi:hypothetical protein